MDAVTSVVLSSANHIATLTLATAVANGGILNITGNGTNPAPSGATQTNEITVQPGNGTSETTNAIAFGQSVTGVSVSPSSRVAGASSNYFVSFRASDAIPVGGQIILNEPAGQTGFPSVTGIEVTNSTRSWHLVATGSAVGQRRGPDPVVASSECGRLADGIYRRRDQPPGRHGQRLRRIDHL